MGVLKTPLVCGEGAWGSGGSRICSLSSPARCFMSLSHAQAMCPQWWRTCPHLGGRGWRHDRSTWRRGAADAVALLLSLSFIPPLGLHPFAFLAPHLRFLRWCNWWFASRRRRTQTNFRRALEALRQSRGGPAPCASKSQLHHVHEAVLVLVVIALGRRGCPMQSFVHFRRFAVGGPKTPSLVDTTSSRSPAWRSGLFGCGLPSGTLRAQ